MSKKPIKASTVCLFACNDADCYGHINNGSLPKYFDLARVHIQNIAGLSDSGLKKAYIGLFVTEASYTYRGQLFPEQEVRIDSELTFNRGAVTISHEMCLEERIVASARTKHIFVDLRTGKAARGKGGQYAKNTHP